MTTTNILAQIKQRQNSGLDLSVLFDDWDTGKAKVADKERPFDIDILVLSCCLHRNIKLGNFSTLDKSLTNTKLPGLVTDLDYQKAKKIREYYKNKLIMLTLRDNNLTKFRKDLHEFLYRDGTKVLDSHVGLVYRLPEFYEYDMEFDDIFQSSYFTNSKDDTMRETSVRELSFIKKIENKRRHSHIVEYWFQDSRLNKVMLQFPVENPLLHLLDEKIGLGNIHINARYYRRRKDLVEFFVCDKWSFA